MRVPRFTASLLKHIGMEEEDPAPDRTGTRGVRPAETIAKSSKTRRPASILFLTMKRGRDLERATVEYGKMGLDESLGELEGPVDVVLRRVPCDGDGQAVISMTFTYVEGAHE